MRKPVIIVEDDRDLREELEIALRSEGYDVRSASNGREGLYAMIDAGNSPVLLLDLMMPLLNGWDVLDWLQRIESKAQVVAMSAVAGAEAPPGAVAFLRKPLKLEVLLPLIRELVA